MVIDELGGRKMEETKQIGWGVLGCGDVVKKKWAASMKAAPGNRVIGVFDVDLTAAAEVAKTLEAKAYESFDAMLSDKDVEIVYVAVPHFLHYEMSLRALRSGKHVLCEKPMALSASQGREMVETAESVKKELFVDYYRRFHPIVRRAKEHLERGEIGEITLVEFRSTFPMDWTSPSGAAWLWQRAKSGGGPIMNIGVHRIDVLHYLMGPAQRVAAFSEHLEADRVEKWISGLMAFPSGANGVMVVHSDTHPPGDVLAFHGRLGSVTFEPFDKRLVVQVGREKQEEVFQMPDPLHGELLEHIAAVLRGNAENSIVSGKEAFHTIELVSGLYTSAREGRAIEIRGLD